MSKETKEGVAPQSRAEVAAISMRLRQRRRAIGMSIPDAAEKAGLSKKHYLYIEGTFGPSAQRKYLDTFVEMLGVNPRWVINGELPIEMPCATNLPITFTAAQLKELGARLRQCRERLGLSRDDVREKAGLSSRGFYLWEKKLPVSINAVVEAQIEDALCVPRGWIRNKDMVATPATPEALPDTCLPQTAASEIRQVATWLSRAKIGQRTSKYEDLSMMDRRFVDVVAMRYGVMGEDNSPLRPIAATAGISSERVRQLLVRACADYDTYCTKTPIIDGILAAVTALLPANIADLDERFKPLLGEQLTIEGVVRFATDILHNETFSICRSGSGRVLLMAGDESFGTDASLIAEIKESVRRFASQMIRSGGAAQIDHVAKTVSRHFTQHVRPANVRAICMRMKDFEWLSEDEGWFWFGENSLNKIASSAKKILSVAKSIYGVDAFMVGAVRARRESKRTQARLDCELFAPKNIVEIMLERTSWLNIDEGCYSLKQQIPPEFVLSHTDIAILSTMKYFHCVASRHDLVKTLVDSGLMPAVTMTKSLDGSPIFKRVSRGVYACVGLEFSEEALLAAQSVYLSKQATKNLKSSNLFHRKETAQKNDYASV